MNILIVDDHPLVREAMARLVTALGESVRVLQAGDCPSALALASATPDLDLLLLDLNLPGMSGLQALQHFRSKHPSVPVVVISMHRDRDTIAEVMRQGAAGFITKSTEPDTILNALRLVLAGSLYVPPEAALDLPGAGTTSPVKMRTAAELGLSPRQGQVLALVMQGHANKEICRELGLAERTVKAHLTAVLNALKVSSRTQAVIAANKLGCDPANLLAAPATDE